MTDEHDIRAALRERLSSSNIHPDHGGNDEDAKRLIAAKNLLVERLRANRRDRVSTRWADGDDD